MLFREQAYNARGVKFIKYINNLLKPPKNPGYNSVCFVTFRQLFLNYWSAVLSSMINSGG